MTRGGCTDSVVITIRILPGDTISPAKVKKLAARAADVIHDTLADETAEIAHTWAIYEGAEE